MLGNLKFDVARPWTPDPHIHTSYELGVSTTPFWGCFFKPGNLPYFSAKFIQGKVCGSPFWIRGVEFKLEDSIPANFDFFQLWR